MSKNRELARRCALEWYVLSPELAREWFADDAIYENRCDRGPTVVGPDEIYAILDAYRKMCVRFEGRLLNIAETGDVVLLEREERTHLASGAVVDVPVMDSFSFRDGKIAVWREYWDLAVLTRQLLKGEVGEAATERYRAYQAEATRRGTPTEPIE